MPKARRRPSKPPSLLPTGLIPTAHTLARGDYEVTRVELNGPKVARNKRALVIDSFAARHKAAAERIIEAHWTVFEPSNTKDPLDQRIRGAYVHETEAAVDRVIRAKTFLDRVERRTGSYKYALIERACVRNESPQSWPKERVAALLEGLDIAAEVLGLSEEK